MIVPWFEAKGIAELKSGDTITYVIFLKDSAGRKSNTISYEYEFVGVGYLKDVGNSRGSKR